MRNNLAMALKTLLHGELSSIEFVRDYCQLRFDTVMAKVTTLTLITNPYIIKHNQLKCWHDYGFKDDLCINISATVVSVEVSVDCVRISFDNFNNVYVSLRPEDYLGPEALELRIGEELWAV